MRSRGVGMLPPSSESHRLVPTQKTKDQDQSRGFSELAIDQRIRPVKLHHSADRAAQVSSARVIVVGNEKGASGKSTVAMHVAIALMKQNKRHKDMHILTYVLAGSLVHKDSLGNGAVILPGDVQRMSAGTGIVHSEFNGSKTEPVHFLQIWIIPNQERLSPSYEQRAFPVEERRGRLRLVASQDGQDGSVTIHQDLRLFVAMLESGDSVAYQTARGHGLWLQVARGIIALNGIEMREGDGAAMQDEETIAVEADTDAESLLFDLA
jgi:quercetin 2,3-dioxygenase